MKAFFLLTALAFVFAAFGDGKESQSPKEFFGHYTESLWVRPESESALISETILPGTLS